MRTGYYASRSWTVRRAPWHAGGGRAAYLGVACGHTRAHLAQAMLEGIAYAATTRTRGAAT